MDRDSEMNIEDIDITKKFLDAAEREVLETVWSLGKLRRLIPVKISMKTLDMKVRESNKFCAKVERLLDIAYKFKAHLQNQCQIIARDLMEAEKLSPDLYIFEGSKYVPVSNFSQDSTSSEGISFATISNPDNVTSTVMNTLSPRSKLGPVSNSLPEFYAQRPKSVKEKFLGLRTYSNRSYLAQRSKSLKGTNFVQSLNLAQQPMSPEETSLAQCSNSAQGNFVKERMPQESKLLSVRNFSQESHFQEGPPLPQESDLSHRKLVELSPKSQKPKVEQDLNASQESDLFHRKLVESSPMLFQELNVGQDLYPFQDTSLNQGSNSAQGEFVKLISQGSKFEPVSVSFQDFNSQRPKSVKEKLLGLRTYSNRSYLTQRSKGTNLAQCLNLAQQPMSSEETSLAQCSITAHGNLVKARMSNGSEHLSVQNLNQESLLNEGLPSPQKTDLSLRKLVALSPTSQKPNVEQDLNASQESDLIHGKCAQSSPMLFQELNVEQDLYSFQDTSLNQGSNSVQGEFLKVSKSQGSKVGQLSVTSHEYYDLRQKSVKTKFPGLRTYSNRSHFPRRSKGTNLVPCVNMAQQPMSSEEISLAQCSNSAHGSLVNLSMSHGSKHLAVIDLTQESPLKEGLPSPQESNVEQELNSSLETSLTQGSNSGQGEFVEVRTAQGSTFVPVLNLSRESHLQLGAPLPQESDLHCGTVLEFETNLSQGSNVLQVSNTLEETSLAQGLNSDQEKFVLVRTSEGSKFVPVLNLS